MSLELDKLSSTSGSPHYTTGSTEENSDLCISNNNDNEDNERKPKSVVKLV